MPENAQPPLIAHVIRRLAVGGLENGLINLINHMPYDRYRHAIICLMDSTDYSQRVERNDVRLYELHQRKGGGLTVHKRFFKMLRSLRPAIVHTRNLPALEFQVIAALAGVRARVHGEHGRDMYDLDGSSRKYNLLRKAIRPFVGRYTAVSADLARWLMDTVGVRPDRVNQIYNGVDVVKFHPRRTSTERIYPEGFAKSGCFVVGTVGRMEAVKDQLTLVRAFLHLVQNNRNTRERMRLIIIGDGSLRRPAMELLRNADAENLAWLPGDRKDVPELLRSMDLFVLPSLREGISNTILEAMASGLPVVATHVGGNPEIVESGVTGMLVPHSDPISMAEAIRNYVANPVKVNNHGLAGRQRTVKRFSMNAMITGYLKTYDSALQREGTRVCSGSSQAMPFHRF